MIIVLRSVEAQGTPQWSALEPDQIKATLGTDEGVEIHDVENTPTRKELKKLNPLPEYVTELTPTLDEIAAQPDVPHLGEPGPAPHVTSERVRVVVLGMDATVQAVASKLMRIDAMWAELAYVPLDGTSDTAANWALSTEETAETAVKFALTAQAKPTPVIRDEHAQVILGRAEVTGQDKGELFGEVIVDSDTLYHHDRGMKSSFTHGVRLVPAMTAPGIAAVQLPSPEQVGHGSWWDRFKAKFNTPVEPTVMQGRAMQAGGRDMLVTRDGVPHPRALKTVTFYRHLRDGQFVRR